MNETIDGGVAPGKGVARDQILVDPLGQKPLLDGERDLGPVNLAEAAAASVGAGGRNGWV